MDSARPAAPLTAAASSSSSAPPLSYEAISKLFHLPIAEAAPLLGVCTSALKKICRSHGIDRWPYRKPAGKNVDSGGKDAEGQKGGEPLGMPKNEPFKSSFLSSVGSSFAVQNQNTSPQTVKAGLFQENSIAQGAKMAAWNSTKYIATYMDEFRYGFPSNGLSSASSKWWGSSGSSRDDSASASIDDSKMPSNTVNGDAECSSGDHSAAKEPSSQLCSLRRKAVEEGARLLKNGRKIKDPSIWQLNKRQKLVLANVFGTTNSDLWKGE